MFATAARCCCALRSKFEKVKQQNKGGETVIALSSKGALFFHKRALAFHLSIQVQLPWNIVSLEFLCILYFFVTKSFWNCVDKCLKVIKNASSTPPVASWDSSCCIASRLINHDMKLSCKFCRKPTNLIGKHHMVWRQTRPVNPNLLIASTFAIRMGSSEWVVCVVIHHYKSCSLERLQPLP